MKLKNSYIDRDLSWMYFNRRILSEAARQQVPLLERLTFLGIYSNNLDEFFRVRMATLNRIAECSEKCLHRESEHAKELIKQINKLNNSYAREYEHVIGEVTKQLRQEHIYLLNEHEIDEEQQAFVSQLYRQKLNGFISPVWLSAVKQLTDEADENIYLAIKLLAGKKKADYALISLPVAECGRFVRLPDKDGNSYLMYMDDVVRHCLPIAFSGLGYNSFEAYAFKFTKDAEMEIDNDLRNGMLQKISKGVKSRKKGDALRVIYDANMPKDLLKRVMTKLNLDKLDTVLAGGRYHNHKDLMSFPDWRTHRLEISILASCNKARTGREPEFAAPHPARRPLYTCALPQLRLLHPRAARSCYQQRSKKYQNYSLPAGSRLQSSKSPHLRCT